MQADCQSPVGFQFVVNCQLTHCLMHWLVSDSLPSSNCHDRVVFIRVLKSNWFSLSLLRYVIGLKDSHHFFIQSEVKPKSIVTCSHAFPRVLRQLHVITSSFDWSTVLSVNLLCDWLE